MTAKPEIRTMLTAVYGPSLVYSVGQGAIIPVIALSARELGASVGLASFVVALVGLGQIAGDIPAGAIAARLGERNAMLIASGVATLGVGGCLLAPSVWLLALGILGAGLATSVWQLARLSFVTETVPFSYRGRALSALGGVQRFGRFVGPFVGAGVISLSGSTKGAYWVYLAAALAAGGMLLLVRDVSRHQGNAQPVPTFSVLRDNWPVLRTLGLAALMVG